MTIPCQCFLLVWLIVALTQSDFFKKSSITFSITIIFSTNWKNFPTIRYIYNCVYFGEFWIKNLWKYIQLPSLPCHAGRIHNWKSIIEPPLCQLQPLLPNPLSYWFWPNNLFILNILQNVTKFLCSLKENYDWYILAIWIRV